MYTNYRSYLIDGPSSYNGIFLITNLCNGKNRSYELRKNMQSI